MTEEPKRGRPRKYGKRLSFNFRITPELRAKLLESAAKSGRSLSEEIETRLAFSADVDQAKAEIARKEAEAVQILAKAAAALSASEIQKVRLAGLLILRESGKARRVIVDYDALLAESDGLQIGLRPGFTADEGSFALPANLTAAEVERVRQETEATIEKLRQTAAPKKPGEEAA
jgi:TraY domain